MEALTHLVLLGGVGACLPALVCPPPPPAAPRLSWTRVDLLVRMAEAGLGEREEPGMATPRGEGSESSLGGRIFLEGNIGV